MTIKEIIQNLRVTMTDARVQDSHFESWLIQNEGICDAIDALKELDEKALALPAQEPVAWMRPSEEECDSAFRDHSTVMACKGNPWTGWVPLYTAPTAAQPAQEVVPLYTISLQKQEPVTHTINSTGTAAVATDYYWIPIDANTPRGVKLQLLGKGGVAQYSNYHGDAFWSHWAPLPKRKD